MLDEKTLLYTKYSDYRKVENLLVSFAKENHLGGLMEDLLTEYTDIQINIPLDDSLFEVKDK